MKEVLTSIKKAGIGTALLASLLLYSSCQDDTNVAPQLPLGDEIKFSVVSDSIVAARALASGRMAVQESRHFLTTIGKDSLFLYSMVEENNDTPRFRLPMTSGNSTRGISYGSGELSANAFYVTAFLNQDAQFMNNTKVEKKDGGWSYAPIKYWPNNATDKVNFFGYLTTADGPIPKYAWDNKKQAHIGEFSYELPASDAENQPDLIFAMTPNQTKANNPVELMFYHALSAIQFKVGTLPEDINLETLTVGLQDVKDRGKCVMTPNNNGGVHFEWENTAAQEETYLQEETYSQVYTKSGSAFGNGEVISADATTFMMVPQTFEENDSLVISFRLEEKNYRFSYPLNKLHADWQANEKYTYTLSITEYVEVDVEDRVSGENNTLKDQVTIQNTGLADVYIRTVIVGYWMRDNNVVAGWKIDDDEGRFVDLPGDGWTKGADGFYYHQAKVKAGAFTSPLFTSYKLSGNPPVAGSSLKLNIVVQAVKSTEANTAGVWKDAISSIDKESGILKPKTN